MARFKGIDIPNNKRVEIALTYIYGIGRNLSKTILKEANVNVDTKVKDLTEDEQARIREQLDKHVLEGDLRREVSLNIKWKLDLIKESVIKKVYQLEDKALEVMQELVKVKVKQ